MLRNTNSGMEIWIKKVGWGKKVIKPASAKILRTALVCRWKRYVMVMKPWIV